MGRLSLTEEKRRELVADLQALFLDEFDEELSELRARRVLDHFVETLGPEVGRGPQQLGQVQEGDRGRLANVEVVGSPAHSLGLPLGHGAPFSNAILLLTGLAGVALILTRGLTTEVSAPIER